MIRHWLPDVIGGVLAIIAFAAWAVQMTRTGAGNPLLREQRLREHLDAEAERLIADLPDPWDARWTR